MSHMKPDQSSPNRSASADDSHQVAFTFVELLVVIAVIGLLSCVLGTAMAMSRTGSKSFQCLNNHRQLITAWKMYSDDNRGQLVYNHDGGNAGKAIGDEAWAGGWLDLDSGPYGPNPMDNTNINYLISHTPPAYAYCGYLGQYLKVASPFKCPADESTRTLSGRRIPRVRSVSMNILVGAGGRSYNSG